MKKLFRLSLTAGLSGSIAIMALAESTPEQCPEDPAAAIWTSPSRPEMGETLKIMAVLTGGPADSLAAFGPEGENPPLDAVLRGGPPWSLSAEMEMPREGSYRIEIRRGGEPVACRLVTVGKPRGGPSEDEWDTSAEAFYAAWIERLFDGPPDESLSFPSLEPVLRDPERNFLHSHLGIGEDDRLPATPDCADLPYFLRAYFAWKVGLPVAYRACDRGTGGRPPRCGGAIVDDRSSRAVLPAGAFTGLMRKIADTVHSGSARTGLAADATDFYPVPLDRASLWPGTVYADPYGHTLILVKWIPQTTQHGGLLLAVDAQPDNSVGRKRFWEGNFLFTQVPSAGPGFKAFRPLLRDTGGRLYLPSNAALSESAPVAPYSEEQAELSPEDFYAEVGKLIDPKGLAPEEAYEAMLDALVEQLETRVGSIENGEDYLRQHRGVIPMPSGAAIFETMGPWEDYSTPSRDLRLLIAMDVLSRLPERLLRYPELFALGGKSPAESRTAIERLHAQRVRERRFRYRRSDGSPWELSVEEVLERGPAFEVGYNPNDCPEVRWGAEPGTAEYAPCTRHAPAEQRVRMAQYRGWFHRMQRPSR